MPDFIIDNWQYGLDTRRSELTSKAGTLETSVNGHINQGGEWEKRKAFVRTALPTNSFGLEVTDVGLTVFGSVAVGALSIALPAGFTYQRLQHPDASTAMTKVVRSKPFGGKAWVIAKFADGNTYCYYDGALIKDFTDGLILAQLNTNVKVATELVAEINRTTLYTATQLAPANDNKFDSFSLPGATYVITEELTTVAGTLTNALTSVGTSPTSALSAIGQFSVIQGTSNPGTNKITSVTVNTVEILNVAVNYTTSPEITAELLAAQINTYTSSPDYTAQANGNTVIITAVTSSSTPNGFVVQVTSAGNVCIGQCVFSLQLAAGSSTFNITTMYINGIDVLGGTPVTWSTTVSALCTALATAIRAYNIATVLQYAAVAVGNSVYVSKLVTASSDGVLTVVVNVSTGGNVIEGTGNPLNVTLNKSAIIINQLVPSTVAAQVYGGNAPYFYSWVISSVNPGSGSFTQFATSQTGQSTKFASVNYAVHNEQHNWICRVTDSSGTTIDSPVVSVTSP